MAAVVSITTSDSFKKIFNTDVGMVYGFRHCGYWEVSDFLRKAGLRLYDCILGDETKKKDIPQIISGSKDTSVYDYSFNRICKTALVNLIAHNYLLHCKGEPIIPIIFLIERDGCSSLTKDDVFSRGCYFKTHNELRRAHKLCLDPRVNAKIREIAQQTFNFVRTKKMGQGTEFSFSILPPPWDPDFNDAQNIRGRRPSSYAPVPKTTDWRDQLHQLCGFK